MTEPLLHVDGATEGTTQWRAETLQMVNWGGFEGHHQVTLAPRATLLSGPSGAGKSSLLDAYLALMMPSDTPFNGASNDATQGRARSADQRNLLTYLRGKTDSAREAETGELRDRVLRGAGVATWGAVSMTFIDDHRRRFTALRVYYVPPHATKFADITMKMATCDGTVDLRELEPLAKDKFDRRVVRARFPDMALPETYAAFAQTLHTRLGIGANGDGANALRLLARIQGGQQVRTVDGLYKSMVLEEPGTYAAADKALAHFADLEVSYEEMLTEHEKAKVLSRLPDLHTELEAATVRVNQIDTLGLHRDGDTPFRLWSLHTETRLLDAAVEDNRNQHQKAEQDRVNAHTLELKAEDQLEDIITQQRANGGDALNALDRELKRLELARDQADTARATFDRRVAPLRLPALSTRDQFDTARSAATTFVAGFAPRNQQLVDRRTDLHQDRYPLLNELKNLRNEAESLSKRDGLVPDHLHRARLQMAEAAGLSADQLPFVAELVDLAAGEDRWRKAAEATLSGIARTVLVDENHLDDLRRRINSLRLPTRIRFEGVRLRPFSAASGNPRHISAKLVFKDSLFSGWVQDRAASLDALCVDSADDLRGPGRRVTAQGQISDGRRGSHGDTGADILGFSNQQRIADITADMSALQAQLGQLDQKLTKVDDEATALLELKEAHQYLLDAPWEAVDVDTIDAALDATQEQRRAILANSDVLAVLQKQHTAAKTELDKQQSARHLAEDRIETLDRTHLRLVERQDKVGDDLHSITDQQLVTLSDADAERLTAEFSAVGNAEDLKELKGNLNRLRDRLTDSVRKARLDVAKAEGALVAIFEMFSSRWPNPNRGVTLASYSDYEEILEDIEATGLHDLRREWSRRLSEWSGEDLVPLNGAFDTAIEEIEDRLRPVNDILATLPFGAGRDRLKIALRRLSSENVKRFRQELKFLSSGVTGTLDDDQTEERFLKLRTFMTKIAKPEAGSQATAGRDLLLDVRRHVEITAVRGTTAGVEISTYSSLGGKSGGETQELVAFIVGAALRFQLGDESRTRPRFAPVFLDEGFVKADSEFAGRSVAAWQGLGFQLIVGAPLDKVPALEPYMDLMLSMTKSERYGYSYITPLVAEPGEAA